MRAWQFLLMGLLMPLTLVSSAFAVPNGSGGELPLAPDGLWAGRPYGSMGPGELGMVGPGMVGPGMIGPVMVGPDMVGMGMGMSMVGPDRMLDSLDLSPMQKERLKELRRARRDRIQKLANSFDDAREDFEDLLNSSARGVNFDQKIRAKHAEMLVLQQALEAQIFESILEIRGLLSPVQLKKFNQMSKTMPFRGPGVIGGPAPWGHLPGRVGQPEDGR